MPIDASTLDPDPVRQLERWVSEAAGAGIPLANAFALATADSEGMPSVRFVLAQGIDAEGIRFFTNRSSRKGRDLATNPWASAAFWWAGLDRQVRVTGPIRLLPEEESLAYWRTRPRGSQLSATVSAQSQEVASRAELEERVLELDQRLPGEIPLPPTWGGYLVSPRTVEFWESRPDRLHDRVEFRRGADGSWHPRRLQP